MSVDSLRSLVTGIAFAAFSVAITVTPADDDAILTTTGVWFRPLDEDQPFGSDLRRRDARKLMAIQRTSALSHLARGSTILAPEIDGGAIKTWRVDGYDSQVEPDVMRVILVEAAA